MDASGLLALWLSLSFLAGAAAMFGVLAWAARGSSERAAQHILAALEALDLATARRYPDAGGHVPIDPMELYAIRSTLRTAVLQLGRNPPGTGYETLDINDPRRRIGD